MTVKQCLLLDLSHDEVSIVTHELCDPLRPWVAVYLSSTAKGLRLPMQQQLEELKRHREEANSLAFRCGYRHYGSKACSVLRRTPSLEMGSVFNRDYNREPTLAHWHTLGDLVRCGSMSHLQGLNVFRALNGNEGVSAFAPGFGRGGLPILVDLNLIDVQLGPSGAIALAAAFAQGAAPMLCSFSLSGNHIEDAGLIALAPALRRLQVRQGVGCRTPWHGRSRPVAPSQRGARALAPNPEADADPGPTP